MPSSIRLRPDDAFVDRLDEAGGGDVKKCYQCATCSVVCKLTPEERPFPRKEMLWAQWGLVDRLVADPDVWLCYQCGDCTTHCPRGARPAEVLGAVREQTVAHYAMPRLLAGWVNRPRFLPLLLGITAVLVGLALLVRDPAAAALGFDAHPTTAEWEYASFFPHWLLIGFFTGFSALAGAAGLMGVFRFWRAMEQADSTAGRGEPAKGLVASIYDAGVGILRHDRFTECGADRARLTSHLGVFYGFIGLLIVTLWAILVLYVFNILTPGLFVYPFTFFNPVKVFANLSGLALICGTVWMIYDRLRTKPDALASSSFDWVLAWVLLAVGVTGVITEGLRFAQLQTLGYTIYFVHLVVVFALLIYLPYSKLAHVLYRTTALVYAEHTGRVGGSGKPGGVAITIATRG